MARKKTVANKSTSWSRVYIEIPCDVCGAPQTVGSNIIKVTCSNCVRKMVDLPDIILPDPKPNMPKGWRKKARYVHEDGTVYENGIENEELFGTIAPKRPRIVKAKKEKPKKFTVTEISENRKRLLAEIKFLKDQLLRAANSTDSRRISKKIESVTKELHKLK